jgi:beta-lactamase regulating signal transducer with metallopeptidase domain
MDMLEEAAPRALGWTLAHFIWQGVAIGLILLALLRYGRVRSAGARYLLGCVALLACIAAAAITFALEYRSAETGRAVSPAQNAGSPPPPPAPSQAASQPGFGESSPVIVETAAPEVPAKSWVSRTESWLQPVLPWLVLMWGIGVLLLSVRLMGGWAFTQHLKHRLLKAVPDWLGETFSRLREKLGVYKLVRIFESAAVESPLVIGWLKPVVLLPACAITGLSPEQLRTLLAHELAHIRRHDYLINLLQSIAETALFFHPAVWWISGRIRDEREHCCDDIAIAACGHELEYAEALAALAEQRHHTAQFALSATGGSLFGRIQRILAGTGPAVPVSRPAAALAGALMLSLVVTVVAQAYMLRDQRKAMELPTPYGEVSKGWPERYRRPVTVTWEKTPLSVVAASFTTQTGLVIPIPAEAADELLTVRFDGAPLHMALDAVLSRVRVGWRLVGNDQMLTTPWEGRQIWIAHWKNEAAGREFEKEYYQAGYCPVVYAARGARLDTALNIVGAQMGCRITVPEAERGKLLTFNFHQTLARDTLAQLLTPLGLDYRVINDAEIQVYRR